MNLPTEIKTQKQLMEQALNKLYLLEHVPAIIAKFDETRAAVVKDELVKEYTDTMAELFKCLITV